MQARAALRSPVVGHVVAGAVLAAGLVAAGGLGGGAGRLGEMLLQLLAGALVATTLHRRSRRMTTLAASWTWGARSVALWSAGQAVLTLSVVLDHATRPWSADLLFLAAAALAVRAALLTHRGAGRGGGRGETALDATVVAASVLFLVQARLAPALQGAGTVAVLYPLIDAAIVTVLVVAAVRGPREHLRSLGLAALGLLVLAGANLEGLRRQAAGLDGEGPLLAAAFVLGLWLVGLGGVLQRDDVRPVRASAPPLGQQLLPCVGIPVVLLVAVRLHGLTSVQQGLLVLLAALLSVRHVLSVVEATRARAELSGSERRYRRVVETAQEGIWVSDVEGRATLVNDRACEMLGLPRDEILGRVSVELVLPLVDGASRAEILTRAQDRQRPGAVDFDVRLLRSDGTVLDAHVLATTLHDEEGRFDGTLTMATDISGRVALEQRLWTEARTDPLTGLANRLLLQERVAEMEAAGGGGALVYCDLDGFKAVNDSFGHGHGDDLLRQVADRLVSVVGDTGLVARLGGDEFAVLCAGAATLPAHRLAASLQCGLDEPFVVAGRQHLVSTSIGVAVTDGTLGFDGLLRNADVAMYAAKAHGGMVRVFEPRMHEAVVEHARLEQDLRRAVERDELVVLYQPIVELATRTVAGAEALVRWQHPERGLLAPDAFIDIAEESGAVVALGQRVLEIAVRDTLRWTAEGGDALTTSVNVSPRQLADSYAVSRLIRTVLDSGLLPGRFLFEITERSLLSGDAAKQALVRIRAAGIRIALDDFGTGWSSLSHLRDHRFDVLKLDRSYVQATDDPASNRLVSAAADLARSFELAATAEGIETEAQAARVVAAGCTYGQGWLFGRPAPASHLLARAAAPHLPRPRSEPPVAPRSEVRSASRVAALPDAGSRTA